MKAFNSKLKKISIVFCVAIPALLAGCASIGNSYLDTDSLFSGAPSPGCPFQSNEAQRSHLEKYCEAIDRARAVQNAYRRALGERSKLRRRLGTGLIGLSAATLGFGLSDASTDVTLVSGLLGASGAASYRWLNAPTEERAWIAGYNAIECSIKAMNPLVLPTSGYSMNKIETQIATLSEAIHAAGEAATEVRAWIRQCDTGICLTEGEDETDIEALTARARGYLEDLAARHEGARQTRRAAVKLAGDIERAPVRLDSAIRQIIGEVDLAIQQQGLQVEALHSIVSGIAESYSGLVELPSPQSEPGDLEGLVPDPDAQDPEGVPEAGGEAVAAALDWTRLDLKTPDLEPAIRQIVSQSEQFRRNVALQDLILNLQELESLEEVEPAGQVELSELSARLEMLEDMASGLDDRAQNAIALLDEAVEYDLAVLRARTEQIDRRAELSRKRAQQAARRQTDRYRFGQAVGSLASELRKMSEAVASLSDTTGIVAARQPLEELKSCGVDPSEIIQPLRVEPDELEFYAAVKASQSVLLIGGAEKYSARSLATDQGVSVESRELDGSVFTISVSEDTVAGRYEVLFGDGANRRVMVTVRVSGDDGEQTSDPQQSTEEDSESASIAVDDAEDQLAQRIRAAEVLVTSRTVAEIKRAQLALCLTEDQADGVWGPTTQTEFEERFGDGEGLSASKLSQLIGSEQPNPECDTDEPAAG